MVVKICFISVNTISLLLIITVNLLDVPSRVNAIAFRQITDRDLVKEWLEYKTRKHDIEEHKAPISHYRSRRKSSKLFQFTDKDLNAQISTTAVLPCGIRHSKAKSYNVTWYKTSDGIQLTYRNVTLINDRRFSVKDPEIVTGTDKLDYVRWDLLIALVNPSDEGSYECWAAVSSKKVEKWTVHLKVIEAKAEILGDPQKVFKVGSTLRLSCYVEAEYEDPEYIFWYHRDRMINFDMTNGINIRIGRLGSELVAPRAEFYHSGNYSCVPSNARPANVTVYVYKDNLIPTPPATNNGNRNFGSFFSVALTSSLFHKWL